MPNQDSIRPDPWENYLTTVDAVETLTGYDLFANLPEPYQRCIEAGTNGNNPPLVKGDQTITFDALPDRDYGDPPFMVVRHGRRLRKPGDLRGIRRLRVERDSTARRLRCSRRASCTVTASQAGQHDL